MRLFGWLMTSVAAAALAAPVAEAQTGSGLEEIVVTARKREERLQDVPLAITAFSAEQIAQHQARDLTDIAKLTPGLNFEAYTGGSGTPVIRGASQQRITDLDQNVATFFDGIYLPRQYAISPGIFGLERVEVVKGPQSALYGRNAFMGAINYVTKKPGNTWHGAGEATVGVYDRYDVNAEVEGPLVADKLFIRAGAGYSTFDGDVKNAHPNANVDINPGSPGRLGGWESKAFQGRVVFKPTETLELDFGAYRFVNFLETPAATRLLRSARDTNCGNTIGGTRLLYCGEIPWQFSPLPGDNVQGNVNVDPRTVGANAHTTILRGDATWRPTDAFTVTYEYGHVKADDVTGGSADRDPIVGTTNPFAPTAPKGNQFQISPAGNVSYWSHELRLEYAPTKQFDFLLGGIYSRVNDFDFFPIAYGLPLLGTAPYDIYDTSKFVYISRGLSKVDTKAVFSRINWQASDRLRVSVEGRYQSEDKSLVNGPTFFSPAVTTAKGTFHQFTPRGTVDYKLTDTNLLYATVARGAKAGGFNLNAFVPSQATFDPDRNWTYELGSKNEFLNGSLRVNAAAFYIDWNNRQVNCSAAGTPAGATPPALICNVGKASVKGLELETVFVPTTGLTLSGGLSYNDAKYAQGVIDQRVRDGLLCDDVVCAKNGNVGGKQLERQSKVQGDLDAQYDIPLSDALTAFIGGDASYKSKQFTDSTNVSWLPSRWLLDARFGVRGDRWDVTAWVKNLTDKQYAISAFVIFFSTETAYIPVKGPSRTAGVTARYHF